MWLKAITWGLGLFKASRSNIVLWALGAALAFVLFLLAGSSIEKSRMETQIDRLETRIDDLTRDEAGARAAAALCSSQVLDLKRRSDEQAARLKAAQEAARVAARPKPLADKPAPGSGCEAAARWAARQAPALVEKWGAR